MYTTLSSLSCYEIKMLMLQLPILSSLLCYEIRTIPPSFKTYNLYVKDCDKESKVFTVNTDRTSPSQFVNHNLFKILNHSSPCILGNNIITYL